MNVDIQGDWAESLRAREQFLKERFPTCVEAGQLAIIGLACIFVAATYTLPGLMGLREKRKRDAQR